MTSVLLDWLIIAGAVASIVVLGVYLSGGKKYRAVRLMLPAGPLLVIVLLIINLASRH